MILVRDVLNTSTSSSLDPSLRDALAKKVRDSGGFEATGRMLDVPAATLKRAVRGEPLRRGTRLLIASQLTNGGDRDAR